MGTSSQEGMGTSPTRLFSGIYPVGLFSHENRDMTVHI